MRDLALVLFVMWGLFKTLKHPFIGTYLWVWFSLMNPHKLTWGFAYGFPFAQLIAVSTLIGVLATKNNRQKVWSPETVTLAMFIVWACITTVFAVNQAGALVEMDRFLKTQLFVFLIIALVTDRKKLDWFIWVMVISIGFYGTKGGVFTILTGGSARVWGPEGSFIGGNNEIALALLMTVPLMWYLRLQATNKWVRHGLLAAMLLCTASILGTQSRGAFLGIMAIGAFFWWKSPHKAAASMVVLVVAMLVLMFMPESWWERMNTIKSYEEDPSAMGRINAWWVAWHMANDSITGGGARMFTREIFMIYAPEPLNFHDVHSIYFEMLGEQGWIGFFLFMLLAFFTWRSCARLIKAGKRGPEYKWAADLGGMMQVSLIGYWVSGAFLGLAYFDYYYDLIAAVVIANKLVLRQLEAGASSMKPAAITPARRRRKPPARPSSSEPALPPGPPG
ncbi:MAG: putative O-glycosylation ligase, exosortase A system-associated [Pseudomonadota bacterium]